MGGAVEGGLKGGGWKGARREEHEGKFGTICFEIGNTLK